MDWVARFGGVGGRLPGSNRERIVSTNVVQKSLMFIHRVYYIEHKTKYLDWYRGNLFSTSMILHIQTIILKTIKSTKFFLNGST